VKILLELRLQNRQKKAVVEGVRKRTPNPLVSDHNLGKVLQSKTLRNGEFHLSGFLDGRGHSSVGRATDF
jgi:hypothetical protein